VWLRKRRGNTQQIRFMRCSHFLEPTRLVSGYLYSPSCRELVFSETQLHKIESLRAREGSFPAGSPVSLQLQPKMLLW
jgi:hypothetical protein